MSPDEHIVGIECKDEADMPLAREVLGYLVFKYPGYQWFVYIAGGVVQIKISNWSDKWGMVMHMSQIAHDAAVRRKSVIRSAGEFLERANMIRGRATGEQVKSIEGVPQRHLARAGL